MHTILKCFLLCGLAIFTLTSCTQKQTSAWNKLAAAYYNALGAVCRVLGQYQKALADCNKAIELDPKNAQAYINRGAAYGDLLMPSWERMIWQTRTKRRPKHTILTQTPSTRLQARSEVTHRLAMNTTHSSGRFLVQPLQNPHPNHGSHR